jgi:hypothetical protein
MATIVERRAVNSCYPAHATPHATERTIVAEREWEHRIGGPGRIADEMLP